MFEQAFKNIDDVLHKDAERSSELDYTEQFKVVGIDVGGTSKGFHAVALVGGKYSQKFHSTKVSDIVNWCLNTVDVAAAARGMGDCGLNFGA